MFTLCVLDCFMLTIGYGEAPCERSVLALFKHASTPQEHDDPDVQKIGPELASG